MSSTSRPSLASVTLIAAALVWVFLLAVILMLLFNGARFVGNPLLHFGGWIALTLTGIGHRERIAARFAAGYQPKHPILLPSDVTAEIRQPSSVYRASAHVEVATISQRLTRRLTSVDDS